MRRLRPLDLGALFVIVPLWITCLVFHLGLVLRGELAWLPVITASTGPESPPAVTAFWPENVPPADVIAVGDEVVRVGEVDLAGAGAVRFLVEAYAAASKEGVPAVVRRDGRERTTRIPLVPAAYPWRMLPLSVGLFGIGVLVLFRRPASEGARATFYANSLYSMHWLFFPGGSVFQTSLWLAVFIVTTFVMFPLILRLFQRVTEAPPREDAVSRGLPWVFAALGVTSTSWILGIPFSPEAGMRGTLAVNVAFITSAMYVLLRTYLAADKFGRRQVKWVLFGLYVGTAPVLACAVAAGVDPGLWWLYEASLIATLAIPVCVFVALVSAHLFDIDRLISETAAFSILSILLVFAIVLVVPRALALLGSGLADSTTAQMFSSIAIAVCLVPAQGAVRSWVERLFFEERHALERQIQTLLHDLGECSGARELYTLIGERLDELLRPESSVIYAESGPAYTTVFEKGPALPTAFRASGSLVASLRDRREPLVLTRVAGQLRDDFLDDLDRAALDGLAAAVVLPIRHGDGLPAFQCLGEKRSGDVYTSIDIALLAAIGEKLGATLQHFDEAALYDQAREMQDALRRYVPGAVAEGLERGIDLEPKEAEVSVLFVDIRGYTTLSEKREAGTIFSTINEYTEMVSRTVRERGGTVVEFNGDGMMSVFGAPEAHADKERAAVESARVIVKEVAALRLEDGAQLSAGVGISTGPAFVGNIRAVDRMIWSAIGNTTNLAARFQSLTRDLDASVVVDAVTFARAGAAAAGFASQGAVEIRGCRELKEVYSLGIEEERTGAAT